MYTQGLTEKITPTRAVEMEIRKLYFPDDVLTKACEIYKMLDIGSVPREPRRSKIKCYCIFQAYNELSKTIIPDPCYVGEKLGLSPFDSNQSISKRPAYKNGYMPKRTTQSPQFMLRTYVTVNMSLPDDMIDNITETFDRVLRGKPTLLLEQPKALVAAYILSYAEFAGLVIDKDDLTTVFYIKYPSIRAKLELFKGAVAQHI